MNRLESELFDLEELLIRNDGMADDGTYSTIVGIANDVSELEDENAKLRELVRDMWLAADLGGVQIHVKGGDWRAIGERVYDVLGVEVDG